jgi:hypothetical protein
MFAAPPSSLCGGVRGRRGDGFRGGFTTIGAWMTGEGTYGADWAIVVVGITIGDCTATGTGIV